MNKITSAITCVNCKNVLESPVFLPCSHSICQKHTQKRNRDGQLKAVICHTCNIEHPVPTSGEFPKNAQLADLIDSRINEFDFGKDYNDAKHSCQQFDEMLTKLEHVLADPRNYSYEMINNMRNKVQLRGEELKMKIDEKMDQVFSQISKYDESCKEFLTTSVYAEQFERLNSTKNLARKDLESWHATLDQMKRNDLEWQNIKKQSKAMIEIVKRDLARFQSDLLIDQQRYELYNKQIDHVFQNLEVDRRLNLDIKYCNFFRFFFNTNPKIF
jgi:hypothetical protein